MRVFNCRWRCIALLVVGLIAGSTSATVKAITLNQTDDFQSGDDNWAGGSVTGTPSGGPGGASDLYLQVSSGSFGGDVRLITHNDAQWLGNYTTAGVDEITAELMNFGTLAIPIRAVIRESAGGSSTPGYASSPFTLPADGQWHLATFSLTTGMTGFNSPQSLATDLASVGDFRILSSVSASGIGDVINAQIGIDDITAVPEPSTLILGAFGVLSLGGLLARRNAKVTPAE